MPRNRILAIIASIALVTIAYVMWQNAEPPKPMSAPLSPAASSSPTSEPKLGKVEH